VDRRDALVFLSRCAWTYSLAGADLSSGNSRHISGVWRAIVGFGDRNAAHELSLLCGYWNCRVPDRQGGLQRASGLVRGMDLDVLSDDCDSAVHSMGHLAVGSGAQYGSVADAAVGFQKIQRLGRMRGELGRCGLGESRAGCAIAPSGLDAIRSRQEMETGCIAADRFGGRDCAVDRPELFVFRELLPIRSNGLAEVYFGNCGFELHPLGPSMEYQRLGEAAFTKDLNRQAVEYVRTHPRDFLDNSIHGALLFWIYPVNLWPLSVGIEVAALAGLILVFRKSKTLASCC
jgi:hypothetical protein